MAGTVWSRFWRRERRKVLPGALARAAIRGEPLQKILEDAARGLLQAGDGQRAAVWLESGQNPRLYAGIVVEARGGSVPEEWKQLDVSLPFFRTILGSEYPIEEELGAGSGTSALGPLAGMRRAGWLPLRVQQKTLGLALVAYARPRAKIDTQLLRALADELALAVAQRRDRELDGQWRAELAARNQLQRTILRGAPAEQVLDQIAGEAARRARAEFVALGRAKDGQVSFDFFEGSRSWRARVEEDPLAKVWQTAFAEGRPVAVGREVFRSTVPGNELVRPERLSRVVALPLEAEGAKLGVLLAGLSPLADAAAGYERLECYATLAAAALWEEHQRAATTRASSPHQTPLESAPEQFLVVDRDGVICEANQAAKDHLDLQPAHLGQTRLEELFIAAAREAIAAWRASVWNAPEGAGAASIEGALPGGVTVRLRLRDTASDVSGPDKRWLVSVEDVNASPTAGEERQRLEAELLSLLDSVDSGVLLLDSSGRVRLANPRFAQLMDLDPHWTTAGPGTFDALVEAVAGHFRDPQAFAQRWRELFRSETANREELELVRPARKVVERFARPVCLPQGLRIGWLEVYRDITGQRLIQTKMLQTEKMAALGHLVSGIAHELNNPLTSILGYTQLLLVRRTEAEREADARRIYEEAERAGRIVKNLLLFARETKPERRPVSLNEIVERTLALRSYELRLENISVELELDPELPTTLADANQMQQAVLNLIVNAEHAIRQSSGRGRIRVRTHRVSAQRLALEVADDGPGVPPEIVSRIFDPFFTTKPAGVGTGLGLSIVYGIVQQHGGEVSVDSQPGCGATFSIELPIVSAQATQLRAEEPAEGGSHLAVKPSGALAKHAAQGGERVLVVEDEPTVARLIADVLREEGFQVDTVLDSREGMELVSHQDYALVICDLKMPYLDGQAFYRTLTRAGSPLQHRMVFVTGDTLTPRTLEFLDRTGLPYLAKPFLVEELKLAVQHAFEGDAMAHATAGSAAAEATKKSAAVSRAAKSKS